MTYCYMINWITINKNAAKFTNVAKLVEVTN